MRIITTSIIFIGLLLSSFLGLSQQDTTWTNVYGGNRDNNGNDVISTNDQGFLIIGSSSEFGFDNAQMYFLKLDSLGEIEWSKSHGGTGQESGNSIIQTKDGGYLGVGYTNSWGSGGFDLLLVKLDSNGNLEYERYFGGTDWDFANDVIETDSNYFLIAGETQSFGNGGKDGWIVRYDANNDVFDWNKTIGNSNHEYFNTISALSNGGFVAAGGAINPTRLDEDVLISRLDPMGDTVWNKYFGDSLTDYANDILQRTNSNIVMTGLFTGAYQGIYLLELDTLGDLIFSDVWSGNSNRIGSRIGEIDNNRLGVSGTFEMNTGNFDLFYGYTQPNSIQYSGAKTYGSADAETGGLFTKTNDSVFLLMGNTFGYQTNFESILTIRTQYDGLITHSGFTNITDTSNVVSIKKTFQVEKGFTYLPKFNLIQLIPNEANKAFHIYSMYGKTLQKGYVDSNNEIHINPKIKGLVIIQLENIVLNDSFIFIH